MWKNALDMYVCHFLSYSKTVCSVLLGNETEIGCNLSLCLNSGWIFEFRDPFYLPDSFGEMSHVHMMIKPITVNTMKRLLPKMLSIDTFHWIMYSFSVLYTYCFL